MRVAITGSHGLIGSALVSQLRQAGHNPVPVVRGAPGLGEIGWDPARDHLDPADLASVDCLVHLAGVGLADRRWTAARKQELLDSRIRSTELLSTALGKLEERPAVLVSGSAVGYYGDRGADELTEASGPGSGFLAELCQRWEGATSPAEDAGVRVVHVRTGIVLARHGGALRRQLPLFRFGLGGRLGSGRQYWSWISLDDEVGAIMFALTSSELRGAVNATAPDPVTNSRFTAELARALHRPAVLPVPAFALRLALGAELADEALLPSQRVMPDALLAAGYRFTHPDLPSALAAVLR